MRREIFRAAVRLWITPFFEALSIADWAALILAEISAPDVSAADRMSLTIVLILVLTDLLRRRLNSFCRARFIADL